MKEDEKIDSIGLTINIHYSNEVVQLKLISKLYASTSSRDMCC